MTSRRNLLTTAAALAASSLPLAARAGGFTEHFVKGGTRGIQRGEYTFTPTGRVEGYGTIAIPNTINTFMIPLTKTVFDESGGKRFQMKGDGLVTVLKDDLYQITANLDWPAQPRGSGQDGYDTDLRKLLVKRVPIGVPPPVYTVGEVTRVPPDSKLYDGLAMHDMPGSSAPNCVRTTVEWEPGTIPVGGMVFIDVTLPSGSFTPTPQDFVRAGHTSLTDAVLGASNAGLVMSARMVGPSIARVMIENRYNAVSVSIPPGTMNLVAESGVTSAGNNSDSWTYLNSGPVYLLAGEKIMIVIRSLNPGDFLQIDNASFLRISNVVA